MSKRRSSVLKILCDVPENRTIVEFPSPFRKNCTPYNTEDFESGLKSACSKENFVSTTDLKIFKVIVLGDVAVGKTCIVNRFCRQIFNNNYKATIGVDFEVERFQILGFPFVLQIWDTAGQERFKSIAQSYYRCAHVVIIVFDLTNLYSLSHCKNWLKEALNANDGTTPLLFLVGTKKDLLSNASYTSVEQSAVKIAKQLQAEYWAVSSKTGKNILPLFYRIAALAFNRHMMEEINRGDSSKKEISSDLRSKRMAREIREMNNTKDVQATVFLDSNVKKCVVLVMNYRSGSDTDVFVII